MDLQATYSINYHAECMRNDSLDLRQDSYFPPQWQDEPVKCGLDDSDIDLSMLLDQSVTKTASEMALDHSSGDSSPSSAETSRRSSSTGAPVKKQDRRRAQNRAAQRAYRERKEQLRQELEIQVKMWQDRHQSLRESYIDQAQEVQRLKKYIQTLRTQLLAMHDTELRDNDTFSFDVWPDPAWKAS